MAFMRVGAVAFRFNSRQSSKVICCRMLSDVQKLEKVYTNAEHATEKLYADQNSTWVDRATWCPGAVKPFLKLVRIDRPIGLYYCLTVTRLTVSVFSLPGSQLLFLPCAWGICMAAPHGELPDVQLLSLFGSVLHFYVV